MLGRLVNFVLALLTFVFTKLATKKREEQREEEKQEAKALEHDAKQMDESTIDSANNDLLARLPKRNTNSRLVRPSNKSFPTSDSRHGGDTQ